VKFHGPQQCPAKWLLQLICSAHSRLIMLCLMAYFTSSAVFRSPSFSRMFVLCVSTVFTLIKSASATSWLVFPEATCSSTSFSRLVRPRFTLDFVFLPVFSL